MARLPAVFFGSILFVYGSQVQSHGGKIDENGCHTVRTPIDTAARHSPPVHKYHCHRGPHKGTTYISKSDFKKYNPQLTLDQYSNLPSCPLGSNVTWNDCIGSYTGVDGSKYVGAFRDNKKHGKGTWSQPDLGVFVGEYRNDVASGLGTWALPNGDVFTGEFENDVYDGKGTLTYADGTAYVGGWRKEERHGFGMWRHFSGDTFTGEYRNNKKNGMGKFTFKDGTIREGFWENDEFKIGMKISPASFKGFCPDSDGAGDKCIGIGDVSWIFKMEEGLYKTGEHMPQKGHIYIGEFRKGVPHGLGALINPDKSGYTGLWKNGKYNGYGTYRSPEQTYVGEWQNNTRHGDGTLIYSHGETLTGAWDEGLLKFVKKPIASTSAKSPVKKPDKNIPTPITKTIFPPGERLALVIGNGSYKVVPLDNPVRDARLMAQTLRENGFKVDVLENADRNDFLIALTRFRDKLDKAGSRTTALFYYSGHGVQYEGTNFLIPADIKNQNFNKLDYETETISADRVLAAMSHAEEGVKIVLLDACRSNPFKSYTKSGTKGLGLAKMEAPTGTIIGYATKAGEVAVDGDGPNSPYVQGLVRYINTPGLKVEDVLKKTRVWVLESTNGAQTPVDYTSLTGDFYFRKVLNSEK